MSSILNEDRRSELISRGKSGEREKGDGKTRFEKRVKSKVANTVREYNQINMNSVFKDGILTVIIPVIGETSNYKVKIKFGGFLKLLQKETKRLGKIDLRTITRALLESFNHDDVYIFCSCEDFFYRFSYWATVKDINSGEPQLIPAKITNPTNNKGPGCKHIMLVLSNTVWLLKVASVINNYIKYMERYRQNDYAKIIYPAIYGKEYTQPVQLSMDDSKDEILSDDETFIDTTNEYGRTSGRFRRK